MYLPKDKFNLCHKVVSCILFCLLFFDVLYANVGPYYNKTPLDIPNVIERKSEDINSNVKNGPPISTPLDDKDYEHYKKNNSRTEFLNEYGGLDGILMRYYNEQVAAYGNLNNYHEENYIYSNGQHGVSYYSGVLSGVIKDFDCDSLPELAFFKIRTASVDEFSNKEIILYMVKVINGEPIVTDEFSLCNAMFIGEELECDISIKRVNDMWRIYFDYFEKRVRENEYENRFVSLEYPNALNVITTVNYSASGDDMMEDVVEFKEQVIDSGISLRDEDDMCRRPFLNDDPDIIPIFSIIRVNEKIKEGYVEDYFEQHSDEMNEGGYVKLRYGYTQFIERK